MKHIFSILVVASFFGLNAQTTKQRSVEPFSKIRVLGASTVYYTNSDSLNLKLIGDEKEIENIETKVENGTLIINTRGKNEQNTAVYIRNNRLTGLSCSEASNFRTVNIVKADTMSIEVSGASNVDVKMETKNLVVTESGASNLNLNGNTEKMEAEISGASNLKAYGLVTKNTTIKTSGASAAKIYVTTKLAAKASGASSIKVKGEVTDIDADINSAASVTRIVDKGETYLKDKGDSTVFHLRKKKIIVVSTEKTYVTKMQNTTDFEHWAGFSIGVNGLLTPDATTKMAKPYSYLDLNYSRCINVQLNFFQHNFHLYKNYINLVTGFGIEWRRYMLENNTTLRPDSSFTWGNIDTSNFYSYNKNLFKSTMVQVPLLLDFNTNRNSNKAFHITVGVIGQFMVDSKTKQKLENNSNEFTKVRKDSYNMSPISVKAHASVGYSDFTVFAEYNITPLFDKGEGPQVYPFVAGVRLIAF